LLAARRPKRPALRPAVLDSQMLDHLLMRGHTGVGLWANSAYRSEEMQAKPRARKLTLPPVNNAR